MVDFAEHVRQRHTAPVPQTLPLTPTQVPNNAGGYGYVVDDWSQLRRFLILGAYEGTFYVGERDLTKQNFDVLKRLVQVDGGKYVDSIVKVSTDNLALKTDPAIFALAIGAAYGDKTTRGHIEIMFPLVIRTSTHLFHFVGFYLTQRGWSRWLRRVVGSWYNTQTPDALEYQMLKYQQRDGWSHKDLIVLAHPTPTSDMHNALYAWAVKGHIDPRLSLVKASRQLFDENITTIEASDIIRTYRLSREMLPSALLNQPYVWAELMRTAPMQATLRNLGKMTQVGLIAPYGMETDLLVSKLIDPKFLAKSYLHPFEVIVALRQYAQGKGYKGGLTWQPVPKVTDALIKLFDASVATHKPTGKRILIAVDVSGSMESPVLSLNMSAAEASGWMAGVTYNTEPNSLLVGFDTSVTPVNFPHATPPSFIARELASVPSGGTDCAQPFLWLIDQQIIVDAVVVYTDSETWAGHMHVNQAINAYRKLSPQCKVIWCATTATNVTCVPDHPLNLGIVGFDASVPKAIEGFIQGDI